MIAVTPSSLIVHTPAWSVYDHDSRSTVVCHSALTALRIADLIRWYGLHAGVDRMNVTMPEVRGALRLVQHDIWLVWWHGLIVATATDRAVAWAVGSLIDRYGLMDIPDTLDGIAA